jgi:hypothetical protein
LLAAPPPTEQSTVEYLQIDDQLAGLLYSDLCELGLMYYVSFAVIDAVRAHPRPYYLLRVCDRRFDTLEEHF